MIMHKLTTSQKKHKERLPTQKSIADELERERELSRKINAQLQDIKCKPTTSSTDEVSHGSLNLTDFFQLERKMRELQNQKKATEDFLAQYTINKNLAALVSMGFLEEDSRRALEQNNNDVDLAVQSLLTR